MCEGVKESVLSVCQSVSQSIRQTVCLSVCPVKNFEISTFAGLKFAVCGDDMAIYNVCVPDRDQSSSLLCILRTLKVGLNLLSVTQKYARISQ